MSVMIRHYRMTFTVAFLYSWTVCWYLCCD